MWRTDANGPDGTVISTFRDAQAQTRSSEDDQEFPAVSIAEAGNWWVPILSILGEWSDGGIRLEYAGLEGTTYHVRMSRISSDAALQEISSPCDIYLDSSTLLPAKLAFSLHPPANLLARIPVEVQYGDYQTASGIVTPFSISYYVRGRLLFTARITQFSINQGATDSDFALQ
jgi:hypothetical protein